MLNVLLTHDGPPPFGMWPFWDMTWAWMWNFSRAIFTEQSSFLYAIHKLFCFVLDDNTWKELRLRRERSYDISSWCHCVCWACDISKYIWSVNAHSSSSLACNTDTVFPTLQILKLGLEEWNNEFVNPQYLHTARSKLSPTQTFGFQKSNLSVYLSTCLAIYLIINVSTCLWFHQSTYYYFKLGYSSSEKSLEQMLTTDKLYLWGKQWDLGVNWSLETSTFSSLFVHIHDFHVIFKLFHRQNGFMPTTMWLKINAWKI